MFNIKTLNKISKKGLSQLDSAKYSCGDDISSPVGILVRSADMKGYDFNSELLCIARAGAGVNNIPLDDCASHGIVVFNTPGANANAVKELVVAALLLSSRKLVDGINWTKSLSDKGAEIPKLVEKGKSKFKGPELSGKKLGIIGLGAIGVMVANAATHLGMQVLGYDPYISVDAAWGLSRRVVHAKDLKAIFETCDYITLHVPATDETRGTICAESIGTMKDGVRIINLARNELVVSDDMIAALDSGKVASYVTDFADDALLSAKNTIVFPHLGASTPESEDNCANMATTEMINYIERGVIRNSVNFPNLETPCDCGCRVL
ncbi:MAG: 3-phosphoglycerate dehydrogenase, partial [Clostridia bacterium]